MSCIFQNNEDIWIEGAEEKTIYFTKEIDEENSTLDEIVHNNDALTQIGIVYFDDQKNEENEDLSKEGVEDEIKSLMSKMK